MKNRLLCLLGLHKWDYFHTHKICKVCKKYRDAEFVGKF